jgi:hypothetical protein
MSLNLTTHLGELALTLGELQRQFRSAARLEVGRAVGEAVRQFAVAAICGPARPVRPSADPWDDPWQAAPTYSDNDAGYEGDDVGDVSPTTPPDLARLQAAMLLGISGARWTFVRTRHAAAAIAAGLALIVLGLFGGRSAEALLEACFSAITLLRDDRLVA